MMGGLGIVIPEEFFIPVTQTQIEHWSVDSVIPGTLATVYGRELRSGTPYETLGGALEAYLMKEAMIRVGRPGMPLILAATSPLEYGQFGATGVPGGPSIEQILAPILSMSPFKTDYHILQKVVHCLNFGAAMDNTHYTFIGGYEGTPEGCAVGGVAACLLQSIILRGTIIQSGIQDIRIMAKTSREAIWAQSVERQAINRNTHILDAYLINPVSGAMTETLLREITVAAINGTVSGAAVLFGMRTAGGKFPLHLSGLESRYGGEVGKAAAGMERKQANEIAKRLFPKFEGELKRPNIGVTFPECYDVKTLKPKKEWLDIYKKVKKEVAELGVPFTDLE
jgi:methylamine--corrinoid protein Co-methyltransferase